MRRCLVPIQGKVVDVERLDLVDGEIYRANVRDEVGSDERIYTLKPGLEPGQPYAAWCYVDEIVGVLWESKRISIEEGKTA